MKRKDFNLFVLGFITPLLVTSCMQENLYNPTSENKQVQEFNFSTVQTPMLNVNYKVRFPVLFHVYAENPFSEGISGKLKVGVKPIFTAYTDASGVYNGAITIPAIVDKAYILTQFMGVTQLMTANVSKNSIVAVAEAERKPKQVKMLSKGTRGGTTDIYYRTLGDWFYLGFPDYLSDFPISIKQATMKVINGVLNVNKPINKAYFNGNRIEVIKDAKLRLCFVGANANKNNALFYYCYDTQNEQNLSKDEILNRLVLAFPYVRGSIDGSLMSGNSIDLHYFMDGEDQGVKFPAGTSVGWVLGADAYSLDSNLINLTECLFSNSTMNPEEHAERNHVAMFKTDNLIVLGFEDINNEWGDNDFNDAVLGLQSYPNDAINNIISDIVPSDPTKVAYTNEYKGVLAFEDNWPMKGDYDMNDVMVNYHSTISYNSLNEILYTVDEFKLLWSGANYRNGFGYQMSVDKSNTQIEVLQADYQYNDIKLCATAPNATILLFNDARAATDENTRTPLFRIKTTFKVPVPCRNFVIAPYNPFVLIQNKIELHLPNYKPSNVFDNGTLFGTGDDRSVPNQGIYYRSVGYYPFAINVADVDNLVLNSPKYEGVAHPISSTYPKFVDWVKNQGSTSKDWYKSPSK